MLVIRLLRVGKKKQPVFKVVVTDKKNPPRAGRFVEELGFYNPHTKAKKINGERALYWIGVGAQPSDTVHNMLVSEGVLEKKKRPNHNIVPPKEEETPAEEPKKAPVEKKEEAPAEEPKEAPVEKKEETPAEEPKEEKTE